MCTPRDIISAAEYVGDEHVDTFCPAGLSSADASEIAALLVFASAMGWTS